jgi:hypothetical protein
MSRFPNRRWLVIPTSITGSIDFNQVHQNSVDTLRLSVDGTQTFVKYEINEVTESYIETYTDPETDTEITSSVEAGIYGRPSFYSSSYQEYTHEEILNVLTSSVWVDNTEPSGSE